MNHTLANGLELLHCLACSPHPHRISDLAEKLGLPRSHVHRLLQTLVENRYVDKDANRRYSIGLGALRLGHALLRHIPIRRVAMPHLLRLSRQIKLGVTLALPFDHQAISVAYISHDGKIRPSHETLGGVLSPHASASGKLFLAYLSASERDATIKQLAYPRLGPNTHRSATSLKRDLIEIASRGYSINHRENGGDSASVALPVRDLRGDVIACVGASGGYTDLIPNRLEPILQKIQVVVQNIESNQMEIAS